MKLEISDWMRDELARRQDLVRRLWAGEPVERIPVYVGVHLPTDHTVREQVLDRAKQLEVHFERGQFLNMPTVMLNDRVLPGEIRRIRLELE